MNCVGIDVSKEKSTVCIFRPFGEVVLSPYKMQHTEAELQKLVDIIRKLDGETRVVLEATGIYHLPIVSKLIENQIFVSIINPFVMKKYSALSLRRAKTDKLDAIKIANYGIDNWLELRKVSVDESAYDELKILGRQYAHYIKISITSRQALITITDRTMPGIKNILAHKKADTPTKDKFCDFVERYWHSDLITQKSEKRFCTDYADWAKKKGYRNNESKAKEIYAIAASGIPSIASDIPSTKMLVLEAVRVLKEINQTLESILSQMKKIASTLPEYDVVRAMSGVGDVLAVKLIAEIGNIHKYRNSSALIAYAGIDAPPYESGKFIGNNRRISKRGSALLRKIGYETMRCLKSIKPTNDAAVYKYMVKKETEGKPAKVAKIAALNKFLRIYYARVKEVYIEQEKHI